MLQRLRELPAGVDGLRATGYVTKDDYENVVEPLIDRARRDGRRIRLLYELGPDFHGFTPAAGWEDLKTGVGSMRLFEGCAVVSDSAWIRESTRLMAFLVPCPVRVFEVRQRTAALHWLAGLPEGPGVSYRLLPDAGVVVVEVRHPLRAADFDALAGTVDAWLARHGRLVGIVVHAADFPGWENISGLLRHVRFVHDHHEKVGRIALAADSRLAGLAPHLANHFVRAEVRHFGYDELDRAVAWAAAAFRPVAVGSTYGGAAWRL